MCGSRGTCLTPCWERQYPMHAHLTQTLILASSSDAHGLTTVVVPHPILPPSAKQVHIFLLSPSATGWPEEHQVRHEATGAQVACGAVLRQQEPLCSSWVCKHTSPKKVGSLASLRRIGRGLARGHHAGRAFGPPHLRARL